MRFIGKDPNIIDAYYTATASGAITAGNTCIVNSDGTVSVVSGSSGGTGSGTAFKAASGIVDIGSTFDTTNDKLVVIYSENSPLNSYAKVGTISGTSISFGSEVDWYTGSNRAQKIGATFDSNSGKVVVTYRDVGNGNYGTAIVGTVSGTSISFGTPVVFRSADVNDTDGPCFDSDTNQVVVPYRLTSTNDGHCILGTVSGTSISFGADAEFDTTYGLTPCSAYDTANSKVVIAFSDNNNYPSLIVGTVSGTSISFGTKLNVQSAAAAGNNNVSFDATTGKILLQIRDGSNSNYGTAFVGTVSGTSISVGTGVVYNSGDTQQPSAAHNPVDGKNYLMYRDTGNSNKATYVVGTISGTSVSFTSEVELNPESATFLTRNTISNGSAKILFNFKAENEGQTVVLEAASTNVTTENYIGVADQSYADGDGATLAIVGCIDRNQTGLTAGQQYFIQKDGTIGTTADDPSVLAGTAISATELVVKE
jgi:hypothetical protein